METHASSTVFVLWWPPLAVFTCSISPGFAQSAEHEGTVMDNGYHTELHTYSEREREREKEFSSMNLRGRN